MGKPTIRDIDAEIGALCTELGWIKVPPMSHFVTVEDRKEAVRYRLQQARAALGRFEEFLTVLEEG